MILRILILVFALGAQLAPNLFAGCDRGNHLIGEAGGAARLPGVAGPTGAPGIAGAAGAHGIQGVPGIPGAPGVLDFSDFFALMPPDNAAPVGAATAVQFPQIGSSTGVIVRTSPSSFLLPTIGTYLVEFQVSASEAGQLMLRLSSGGGPVELVANSVVGRATGSDQIVGISLVTTTFPNRVLEVINPPGNSPALTITSLAGGTHAVSAHLTITRIQ